MNFGNLTVNISANIAGLSSALKNASAQVNKFVTDTEGLTNSTKKLNKETMQYGFNVNSIKRIVSGIVIAQAFYKTLGAIQDCTAATFEFANSLEYAKSAYTNLFNDTELAEEFINVLKDYAAKTPFDFSESEAAAKRLLAYGVKYQNVMYVMQGVMAAASMQGDSSKVESISRALGQIYTKGRLMNQEMNQLTEAGIPAWEILQEKIGLAKDKIGDIGDMKIPAYVAINALVDGMTERFGNVVTASSRTLTGIISNIKDNFLMVSAEVVQPLMGQVKAIANTLGEWLYTLREIVDTKGIGGVFEKIVPESAQRAVRTFLANLMNLWTVVKYYLASAFEALKNLLYGIIVAFNALSPAIIAVLDVIGRLLYYLSTNATLMRLLTAATLGAAVAFVIFKAKAIGALVVTAVSKAILVLSKALLFLSTMLTTHPILFLFGLLAGSLVAVAIASSGAESAIDKLLSKLSSINGVDPEEILLPESEDRANDLDKFNEKLTDTTDGVNGAKDAADDLSKSVNKVRKGLLSFDEVFRLTDKDKGTDTDLGYNLDGLDGIGDLDTEAWIPEIPDMTGFGSDFVDSIIDALKNAFNLKQSALEAIMSAGIGAAMGAVIGNILGGPVGAAIGALVGAIVGLLWSKLADELGLTDTQKVAIPIGTFLGAAIGAALGGPGGAVVGAAIGALVSNLIAMIIDGFKTGNWNYIGISTSIGAGIGAAIGMVVGGPGGALIGAAAGSLAGAVVGLIIDGFKTGNFDYASIGTGIGGLIGAGIGTILGGPAGAVIGTAIGALVGRIGGLLVDAFANNNWDLQQITISAGGAIGAALGGVMFGPVGALIGAAIGAVAGWIVNLLGEKLAEADWSGVGDAFLQPFKDLGEAVMNVINDIKERFTTAFESGNFLQIGLAIVTGILEGILGALALIPASIAMLFAGIYNAICTFFGIASPAATMVPIGEYIVLGILMGITGMSAVIAEAIASFAEPLITEVQRWVDETYKSIAWWLKTTKYMIDQWVTVTFKKVDEWMDGVEEKFKWWKLKMNNLVTGAFTWIRTNLGVLMEDIAGKLSTFLSLAGSTLATWASSFTSMVSSAISSLTSGIASGLSSIASSMAEFFSSSLSAISSWASSVASTISSVFSGIKSSAGSIVSKAAAGVRNTVNSLTGGSSSPSGGGSHGISTNGTTGGGWLNSLKNLFTGHAEGGIYDREHFARFAEGNKAEAIIPLENNAAMQPFVDAVSAGVIQTLGPMLAGGNSTQQLQPLYVGTLIADDRGLKELERKMSVIRMQESRRR